MRALAFLALAMMAAAGTGEQAWEAARANGRVVDELFSRTRRMMHAWLAHADRETLLLPDRLPGLVLGRPNEQSVYTPHNSGADNYPFLILTAHFTEPALVAGRMIEMLRNEVRYTSPAGGAIPGNLNFKTRELGPPSWFGAGEYTKDGMVPVTELLGRTPWFYRMVDMLRAFRRQAPVRTRFGNLPETGAELNGDVLQALGRVVPMTGDLDLLAWGEQIMDAYTQGILPANGYLPAHAWNFETATGPEHVVLGDHGNEAIVGLILMHAVESDLARPGAAARREPLRRMLDRVLASANPDGFFYRAVRLKDFAPVDQHLTDNWGYIYTAVYAWHQLTGEEKYRQAVLRVLRNLSRYHDYDWTKRVNTVDDLADSIEGALYLAAHEPAPEALAWIDASIRKMLPYQQPDGTIERWYGDGNWNRTLLQYAMYKTQGAWLRDWAPGVELGAVRDGRRLLVSVATRDAWAGRVRLDYARHRRILNYRRDYARINQWPEWYALEENALYQVTDPATGAAVVRLGSELSEYGLEIRLPAGGAARRIVEPFQEKAR